MPSPHYTTAKRKGPDPKTWPFSVTPMDVVDRGVGGVYLVQRGRGGGGERGYALAVVTWCAACHEKAGKKEGSNAEEAPYN